MPTRRLRLPRPPLQAWAFGLVEFIWKYCTRKPPLPPRTPALELRPPPDVAPRSAAPTPVTRKPSSLTAGPALPLRSGGLSRTDTSLQCGGLSVPDCSDLIPLSLDVLTRQRRKTALESPTPTNKCFSHQVRLLQQPAAQNCLRTLSNHKEQKKITTPFFSWLCHVAYRIPVP